MKKKKDEVTEFRMKNATFKSEVPRCGGFVYSNLERTTPLNDGKYNMKYNLVEPRELEADM